MKMIIVYFSFPHIFPQNTLHNSKIDFETKDITNIVILYVQLTSLF